MRQTERINVSEVIDNSPISGFQVFIIVVCAIVAMLDGYDLQAISFVAPVLSKEWGLAESAMAPVFSIGLFGLMLGALISGPIADRTGRKTVVTYSSLAFGVFSLLTVLSHNTTELMVFRFLTGLGLGGSMPNIISLTAEYSPERVRKAMISAMFCGLPVGAVVGGLLATSMIPAWGWQSLFYLGGIIPMAIALLVACALPESIRFLVTKHAQSPKIARILSRISPSVSRADQATFVLSEPQQQGMPVKHLFRRGYAVNTVLLWIVFFMNLMIIYFVSNWMPTLLEDAGLPLDKAIIGVVMLQGGGVVGGILIGSLGDRKGLRAVLAVAFLAGAVSLAVTGTMHTLPSVMTMVFISGLLVVGTQFGINALAASIYLTSVRSTGVGWALGIGRIGSIVGPLIGGSLIAAHASLQTIFLVAAVPALIAGLATLGMRMRPAETAAANMSAEQPTL
ncbi:MFS transporter [Alicyclobacillus kakegawensis]|uniref:MFS transporter n=1 Tax=Alicyclobacillus kakegawensis TaxID=392012 RepID=UPI00082BA8D2|nr:MFS transporter [Alicyclobacillus kakegawensis]